MSVNVPRGFVFSNVLDRILQHWNEIKGDRVAPKRSDLRPQNFPSYLGYMQLVDVDGESFRYRLVGNKLVDAFGSNFTGKTVDELFSAQKAAFFNNLYAEIRDRRRPLRMQCDYNAGQGLFFSSDRIYCPISQDGENTTTIWGVLTFNSLRPLAGEWSHANVDALSVRKYFL